MRHDDYGYSAGSVFLAFLLGGAVGAGVALLLAPQSGVETRRKIREFTDEVKDKATDYVEQAKDTANTYYGQARETVVTTVDKAKHVVDEQKSAIVSAIDAGKEAYAKEVHKENA
jgi:gas vesicle protein